MLEEKTNIGSMYNLLVQAVISLSLVAPVILDTIKLGKQLSQGQNIKDIIWEVIPTTLILGFIFLISVIANFNLSNDLLEYLRWKVPPHIASLIAIAGFQSGYVYAKIKSKQINPQIFKQNKPNPQLEIIINYFIYCSFGYVSLAITTFIAMAILGRPVR